MTAAPVRVGWTAFTCLALVGATAAELAGHEREPAIDLATVLSLLLGGLLAVGASRGRVAGCLLTLAGATWLVATAFDAGLLGDVGSRLVFAHRALVLHATLAESARAATRRSSSLARVARATVVVAGYVVWFDRDLRGSPGWMTALAGAAIGMVAFDASGWGRRWPAAVVVAAGTATWAAAAGYLRAHDIGEPRVRFALYGIGLATVAIGIASGGVLERRRLASVGTDIISDGGVDDLRVGFRFDGEPELTGVTGERFELAHGERSLAVPLGDGQGEAVIAIGRGGLDTAGIAAELRDGVRQLATLQRARRALDAQATAVTASTQRLQAAEDLASVAIGLELDRLVRTRIVRSMELLRDLDGDIATESAAALADVLAEVNALAIGLGPPTLDGGLAAALTRVAAEQPVPVNLTVDDTGVGSELSRTLYFAAAECVTNAVRHGVPTTIDVTLAREAGVVELLVADDGRGGARVVEGGGLAGLRRRVEAAGGEFAVDGRAGGGTVVTVRLALDRTPA